MTTKSEKDRTKQIQDKCQTVLNEMLRDEDNKYCVDCDTKGPRWASWNLGVFLCIRCAGIHRNLGVHISKVKSVNLDTWTPEQVVSLQQMGNSRARAVYEANLPDNFRRPQSDSNLESFVRAKYEHKKYIAREWVPPTIPKVNWEKEIDEELERQKRKKKQFVENKTKSPLSVAKQNVEIPQIPKPRSVQLNSGASATQASSNVSSQAKVNNTVAKQDQITAPPTTGLTPKKNNFDLLRLDSSTSPQQNGATSSTDDTFSSFLSAPPSTENSTDKQEEENFFNQPAPTEKEKTQLTKDSILALYGNTPQQPANNMFQNFTNHFPNTSGPNFQTNLPQNANAYQHQPGYQGFAYNGFQQFNQAPNFGTGTNFPTNAQNFNSNPGIVPNPALQQPGFNSGVVAANQAFAGVAQKGAFPQNNTFQHFLPQGQVFGQQPPVAQFGIPSAGVHSAQSAIPNPFLNQQAPVNLQQQFGNMTLNNVQQPPVSTNVWQ